MAKHLDLKSVKARLHQGEVFMKPFVAIDEQRSRAFLDASVIPVYLAQDDDGFSLSEPEIQQDVPIGQSNLLTASMLVKIAVVAINRPDWHVTAQKQDPQTGQMVADAESAQIWRQYMRDEWDRKNWQRVFQRMLLKRYVAGLGCVAWSWGDTGCTFENLESWNLRINPFVKDWQNPQYAGRKMPLSLTDAVARYPSNAKLKKMLGDDVTGKGDITKIDVEIYWDANSEIHVWDTEILTHVDVADHKDPKKNHYGRPPLLFLEGDLHPGKSPFPIGDSILAAGSQAEYSDLNQSISNTAKAGAGFGMFDPGDLDQAAVDAIQKGEQQQWIAYKGLDASNPPVYRSPGEELRPAVMEAKREARQDILSLIGVSQMDMGQAMDNVHFATEVAAASQKGGARQNQARAEYETALNRAASICLWMFREFGGPYLHPTTGKQMASGEHMALHEAAMNVTEVKVIESSTTYKDPTIEQQQSMQLYDTTMRTYPLWLNLATIGVVDVLPDMKKIGDRMFRAFGTNQTDQMWIPAPKLPQPQGKDPIESMAYKDVPEDIKRQMEQRAGFQPSQMGGQSDGSAEAAAQGEVTTEAIKQHGELEKQAREQLHEAGLKMMEHSHEAALKQSELRHDALKHVTALESQKQIAAMKPPPASKTNGNGNGTNRKT